jgi:hypothetical protein
MALSQKKLQQKRNRKNKKKASNNKGISSSIRSLSSIKAKLKSSFRLFGGKDKHNDVKDIQTLLNDGYDPLHAIYVSAQNMVSKIGEELQDQKQLRNFVELFGKAEDEYMPQGPPMSPLTGSYFTCWAFCDLQFTYERTKRSMCEYIIDLKLDEQLGQELSVAIQNMQNSRMGVYEVFGTDNGKVILEDLWTKERSTCYVPVNHPAKSGELWFVRLLPPISGLDYHVVFTTPYVLIDFTKHNWVSYIKRAVNGDAQELASADYINHFKFGPDHNYWNEYIFLSYVNHTQDAVFLTGIPDQKHTLPHA